MESRFVDLAKNEIEKIKPLWESLNRIHLEDSVYWKDHYRNFTFEKRMTFLESFPDDDVKITAVVKGGELAGYCISTVSAGTGEIDSLYLDEKVRNMNLGNRLVELHVDWLKSKDCGKIKVAVSHGHESVLKFYNKQGFFERRIELELKQ